MARKPKKENASPAASEPETEAAPTTPVKTKGRVTATWTSSKPAEADGVSSDGRRLRIKQSVGKSGPDDSFWYCYAAAAADNGSMNYLGVEKTLDLAKSRAVSGMMRRAGEDLETWLKQHGDRLPPDLLDAERARLAHWKKFPKRAAETEKPIPAGGKVVAGAKAAVIPAGRPAKPEKPPSPNPGRSGNPGKFPQTAVVRVVKREPTGKPGTKWRTRQEHVFGMDGKTVAEIKDNDAVKHMLQDGTIKLEGT